MDYFLRNSKPEDQEWLESLRRKVYKELFDLTWGGWDEDKHQRHFSSFLQEGYIQIIEVLTLPVGILQIFEVENEITIGEIQITSTYQGQGLGSKILKDVINYAKNVSKNITLSTGLKNQGAFMLYKKLGFQETKRSETHIYMIYITDK